jgi:rhodanese-related sulfurtransferase
MNDLSAPTVARNRLRRVFSIIGEGLAVTLAGLALAVLANQLSPRGLSLTRNYFPAIASTNLDIVRNVVATVTNLPPTETLEGELRAAGMQLAVSNQVIAWFADPRRLTGHIIFVDARNEGEYLAGHVPGAWLFDPYHPEKYFPVVLPAAQAAEVIVVYCHGGDCDDSVTAATLLKDVGIPGGKISVYGGGIGEWEALAQPVETGAQNSDHLGKGAP